MAEKQAGIVTVDVGGVGYEVAIPAQTYSRLGEAGEDVSLHVYTHVRENMLALFGFHKRQDKELFQKFLDVSGVGPRMALGLLSGLDTSQLVTAIRTGDTKMLVRIPGVGKKTGQRIILELKEKLDAFATEEGGAVEGGTAVEEDVVSALANLGCSREAAKRGVRKARLKGAPAEFETLFRMAMAAMKR